MKYNFPLSLRNSAFSKLIALLLAGLFLAAPLVAQQPASPAPAVPAAADQQNDPTFDTLLATDSYKLYGEVRNVGQLLTTGGAGEIVEPVIKLADPGPELKSIVSFLKKNSEPLASSRLMFATWPARTGIPSFFVAIEFSSADEANKFAPKLETFLPTVLPPVPVNPEPPADTVSPQPPMAEASAATAGQPPPKRAESAASKPKPQNATAPPATQNAKPEERLPFVITHKGSLVFISDKTFKFEKLHSPSSPLLSEDHNFRVARDRFSAEPVFLFLNVALEDRTKPKPLPTPVMSDEERERIQREEEAEVQRQIAEERAAREKSGDKPTAVAENVPAIRSGPTLSVTVHEPSPTPTPTKEQDAQRIAGNQIGSMLSLLGEGEPQWPDAVGVALALDSDEYVIKSILIEDQSARRLTLPFVPQLISGPSYSVDAPSILPDDTEVFVSASIDFSQTYQEMKKQADLAAKNVHGRVAASGKESMDGFAQFEKRAGIKISDDLLPVLGNEVAVAATLKMMNQFGMLGMPSAAPPKPSPASGTNEKPADPFPVFMISIRDRDAARKLMPHIFDGLGIGAANMLAQTEHRDDSEIVNYAGIISYAFVGNFLVVSDSASVHRIVDANSNRQTLSSNNAFRNSRRWQPRQTLGEIYVSPALMEGYQEQIRKQAGTMEETMRDFLMQLSPQNGAITYALSHDGLGAVHELHLPKNLIIATVAATSAGMKAMKQGSPEMNEAITIGILHVIANAENQYKADEGSYGSLDNLAAKKLLTKEMVDKYGYRIDLSAAGNGFEVVATPLEYGKTGRRSFYVDQTSVVRGGDHGGGPAGSGDEPVQQ